MFEFTESLVSKVIRERHNNFTKATFRIPTKLWYQCNFVKY